MYSQTIAAIATPFGKGAVAMIRISGDEALGIAERVFKPRCGKKLSEIASSHSVYGDVYKNGEPIDDCLATVYRAPHSYTGEDSVEIFCHGGIFITGEVLSAVLLAGARTAEPGEFSKRAFINGKLTLSQAEAVINTIDATGTDSLMLARSHHMGVFSDKIQSIYSSLLDVASSVYAFADYPDEDLADMSANEMITALEKIELEISRLLATYKTGKAVSEGIYTVIAGKPNTGKSSLLNLITGTERAIVSSVAGTTRDRIDENAAIGRVKLRLSDTAGVHTSDDEIENIGIEKTLEAMKKAELILAIFDGSAPPNEHDFEFISLLSNINCEKIAVVNKSDKGNIWSPEGFDNIVTISAKTGDGYEKLEALVNSLFINEKINYKTDAVVVNARQKNALEGAKNYVNLALSALKSGFTPDVAGVDIESAMSCLGECDGRAVSEDIASAIFSRFCVGK